MEQYIHPNNEEITQFIEELELRNLSLKDTTLKIFEWIDNNIAYSRLNSPYFPLQRSDLNMYYSKLIAIKILKNIFVLQFKKIVFGN